MHKKVIQEFEVGDKVILNKKGKEDACSATEKKGFEYIKITRIEDGEYSYSCYNKNHQVIASCSGCLGEGDFELYKNTTKVKTTNFLLQYEIDSDPFEEFSTIKEVKNRIKELVKDGGHNFVLWEIKKRTEIKVTKTESVIIKGI